MKLWDSPGKMLLRLSLMLLALLALHPASRHAAIALVLPKSTTVSTAHPQVKAQAGAQQLAHRAAKDLPAALQRLQAEQGAIPNRDFAISVYADARAYAREGACPMEARACAFWGGISLSPQLAHEPDSVLPILTHELSHISLQQRMGAFKASRIPPWFAEGLAVLVSDGGGAEGVGQEDARAHLKAGLKFEPEMSYSWLWQTTAAHYKMPPRLFYRQAALFVQFLKVKHVTEFEGMMNRMHAGMGFHAAFERSFHSAMPQLWQEFLQSLG